MLKQVTRISGLLLLLTFWAPVVSSAAGWQPYAQAINKSQNDPRQYQAIKLANDMTVLLVSDPEAPKSLAALAIPVGSLEDPDSQLGLAHYTEHMLLMGSKNILSLKAFLNSSKNTAAATMAARLPTAQPFIWKLKMMPCRKR